MLDINFIRDHADLVKEGMQAKGEDETELVDRVLKYDSNWRKLVQETDALRNESNTKSKKIGRLMGEGKKEEAQAIIDHTSELKEQIKEREKELDKHKQKRDELLLHIPNVPHQSVPEGQTEDDNELFKTWGEPNEDENFKPHWELVEEDGLIDFERGAKVTGAGFPFYKGPIAKLQRGLINFF